jgi:phosphoribosylanthranilate isomerase
MSLWVKICGNTSLADAQLAVDAGGDAVGFVFAPSPRQVTPQQVAAITAHLTATVEKIGVFVYADFATVVETVEGCGLTGVQLHWEGKLNLAAELRRRFGSGLRILQVIHFGEEAQHQLEAARADVNLDAVLVDSRTATAVGGTGIAFDWEHARTTLFTGDARLKLVAAGGLHPDNVAQAVATLRPWGVDVVSGVESSPGQKDPARVAAFVRHARAAWHAKSEARKEA